MNELIDVKPIYGWGWFDEQASIEVPAAFKIELLNEIDRQIEGIIMLPSHFLDGSRFWAWPRYEENNGHYDCEIILANGKKINGYCQIDIKSPNH